MKIAAGILTATLLLHGCGGCSSQSESAKASMPKGVWLGTLQAQGIDHAVLGLIAPNGEARFFVGKNQHLFGKFKLDGNEFSSEATEFATGFNTDNKLSATGKILGSYVDEKMVFETIKDGAVINSVRLSYSALSDNAAMMRRISGTYRADNDALSLVFDSDGDISGSDTNGCVYNGSTAIPDDSINIYHLTLRIESCAERDGTYSGLAYWRAHATSEPEGIRLQVDNSSLGLSKFLSKI